MATETPLNPEEELGTLVAGGNHVVPPGVAVEELNGDKKKLANECPEPLLALLSQANALQVYERLVHAIVDDSKTRNVFGRWNDTEILKVLQTVEDDFADCGVKVVVCKRTSGRGTHRWLEFIDTKQTPNYVPQYDVSNLSGQVIKTAYTKLEFPKGVAVEELRRYGSARKKLKEKIPNYVEEMMTQKHLMEEYHALVDDICAAGAANWKKWDIGKVNEIAKAHAPRFQAKNVDVFVSHKQEYISHGQYGGHTEFFRWMEFVDRDVQPNYFPQRNADTRREDGCSVS